jgi:hypothetical protein
MPRRCLVCGERGCELKQTAFSISWSIGRTTYTRTLTTRAPLCDQHWDHFDSHQRNTLIFLAVTLLFGLGVAAGLGGGLQIFIAIPIGVVGAILSVIAWVVYGIVCWFTLVYATDINNEELTLTNVHERFARAVEDGEDEEEDEEDEDGDRFDVRRGSYRRGDDEDDRPSVGRRARTRRGRDDDDDEPGIERRGRRRGPQFSYGPLIGGLVIGAIVLFGFCGLGVALLVSAINRPQQQQQAPVDVATVVTGQPNPLLIEGGLDEKALRVVYLSSLPEQGPVVGWGEFGKNGQLGFDHKQTTKEKNRILFNGKESQRGLSLHAKTNGVAQVRYRLDGEYKLLRGTAAMADLPADAWGPTKTPVTFHVIGDGKLLWTSKPLQHKGDQEEFRLGVSGVKDLLLCVRCQGQAEYTWSVWLDPYLLR